MAYVMIIVSFVAMGGPKDTTPTIDHIPFTSQTNCEAAKTWVSNALGKVHFTLTCQPG